MNNKYVNLEQEKPLHRFFQHYVETICSGKVKCSDNCGLCIEHPKMYVLFICGLICCHGDLIVKEAKLQNLLLGLVYAL